VLLFQRDCKDTKSFKGELRGHRKLNCICYYFT